MLLIRLSIKSLNQLLDIDCDCVAYLKYTILTVQDTIILVKRKTVNVSFTYFENPCHISLVQTQTPV